MLGAIVLKDILIKVEKHVAPPADFLKNEKKHLKAAHSPYTSNKYRCSSANFLGQLDTFKNSIHLPGHVSTVSKPACESEGSSASKGTAQMPSSTFSASMPRCRASSLFWNQSCVYRSAPGCFCWGRGRVGFK